jgi:hypothetical protein
MASSRSSAPADEVLNIVGTFGVSKRDAAMIYKELYHIKAKHKRLDQELVLEAARSPRSKLHKFFEWDDTVAANKWRLRQASELIRSVKIEVTNKRTKQTRAVRVFVSVPEESGSQGGGTKRSYEMIDDVMNNPLTRRQYLRGFIVRMEQLQADFSFLKEAEPVFRELAKLKRMAAAKRPAAKKGRKKVS